MKPLLVTKDEENAVDWSHSALLLGRAINVIMNTLGQRAQSVVWA